MNRFILFMGMILLLMSGAGCRTYRQSSSHQRQTLDSSAVSFRHYATDSLYRHNLTGEIEWEWEQIDYTPDTLGDTLTPHRLVTRWRKALRISNREEQHVADTLVAIRQQEEHREEQAQIQEKRKRTTSGILPSIALILILLLIYKLN